MGFSDAVRRLGSGAGLVVQPRMGFEDPARMRAGLAATRAAAAATVGTLTVDSFTRLGDLESVRNALAEGTELNGYPIASHPAETTRAILDGLASDDFPVQVRHGSAQPQPIFQALVAAGLHASEGGPVSYCLPYGRTPLDESVRNWRAGCHELLRAQDLGAEPHLESFGGCLLGQLCPPSLLVAVSVLEAMFFHGEGIRSLSVSYAQQTNMAQDREAVHALRRLCAELLPDADCHIVVYTYMGLYPRTPGGARRLLARAVELAVDTGAERLIVKTEAEAYRIPTVEENVAALEFAGAVARSLTDRRDGAALATHLEAGPGTRATDGGEVYAEAAQLVHAVLDCDADLGRALSAAFKRGLLDVPYCLHPDNAGRTRSFIDTDGRLRWADTGDLPLPPGTAAGGRRSVTSAALMSALSYVRDAYDRPDLASEPALRLAEPDPGPPTLEGAPR
ncbi:MAG: methylaspartate mutase [Catenulispora sp.]|nr:methylaspartate mutase [Catenulispora sp.]